MTTIEPESDDLREFRLECSAWSEVLPEQPKRRPTSEPLMPVVWLSIPTISIGAYVGLYALYRWFA